jgi:FMN-dependent NADH-azoreductase
VQAGWLARHPGSSVTRRDIGQDPLPSHTWRDAVAVMGSDEPGTPEQQDSVALAATLVDELLAADALLFAVPLYNFGVPQHMKAWVDVVLTDPRLRPSGGQRPLVGKPTVLVLARGGGYGAGTPREGWDHGGPWVRRILDDVWNLDLRVAEVELTLAETNPAMAALRDKAAQALVDGHALARSYGEEIAGLVSALDVA